MLFKRLTAQLYFRATLSTPTRGGSRIILATQRKAAHVLPGAKQRAAKGSYLRPLFYGVGENNNTTLLLEQLLHGRVSPSPPQPHPRRCRRRRRDYSRRTRLLKIITSLSLSVSFSEVTSGVK